MSQVHDVRRFLFKLSIRKVWNAGLVFMSYHYSRIIRKPVQKGLPYSLTIEPTTACNLRCPECPSGLRQFSRETGNLKKDFFTKVLGETHRDLLTLMFYFQGEPYINPSFLDMVAYANEQKVYTITSTNGHFLSDENAKKTVESGLDRLIISVDGTTQEVYEQYRKEGKLETVLQGARNIVKWKKRLGKRHPYVIFQFLVVRPNEHQIDEVRRLAKEIGIDKVALKSAQVYDYKQGNPLIPKNQDYARYKEEKDGTWSPKHKLNAHCWKLWHGAVITWDGHVLPCCFDKDAQFRLGNMREVTFKEVWQGKAYQDFRETIFKGREHIEICQNCSEGCSVWV